MYREHLEVLHISKVAEEIKGSSEISIIIGPEGGFSIGEHQLAIDWHLKVVHLGQEVLRAETASIAAAATINYIKYSN
jgi:16S rRNA (uracil1498-N3)-methyltransferase